MTKHDYLKVAARYFLRKGDCSNMKLNKLVYIAYGIFLSKFGGNLCSESPQVWQYGPVFPSLYKLCKGKRKIRAEDFSGESIKDEKVLSVLAAVWACYGDMSAMRLSDLTHRIETPWRITADKSRRENGGEIDQGIDIPDDLIREYYDRRFERAEQPH